MKNIIYLPTENLLSTTGDTLEHHFGFFRLKNKRPEQQDALAWHLLERADLMSRNDGETPLTVKDIAHRIFTTLKLIDQADLKGGSTASSIVYDGQGNFVTATLADSSVFAVAYNSEGKAIGVIRMNSITHKPVLESEKNRIIEAGGRITDNHIDGVLAVARALGDKQFKGVCSDASIDITNKAQLIRDFGIDPDQMVKLQIIAVSDGFTDGAPDDTQSEQESYLFNVLQEIPNPGALSEQELAKSLALAAVTYGSTDNITVAVQTVSNDAFMVNVFDGHGYRDDQTDVATFAAFLASSYAAKNVGALFKAQCALSTEEYERQQWSVKNNQAIYNRDNLPSTPEESTLVPLATDARPASTSSTRPTMSTRVYLPRDGKRKKVSDDKVGDAEHEKLDPSSEQASKKRVLRSNAMVRSPSGDAFFTAKNPRSTTASESQTLSSEKPNC